MADAVLDMESKGSGFENSRDMYAAKLKEYGRAYPNAGYGGMFIKWLMSEPLNPTAVTGMVPSVGKTAHTPSAGMFV